MWQEMADRRPRPGALDDADRHLELPVDLAGKEETDRREVRDRRLVLGIPRVRRFPIL